jgi:hypothetical protein
MIIETTVNIQMKVLNDLTRAAIITGLSKRDVISLLLKCLSGDQEKMVQSWRRVRYQKRLVEGDWRCLHVFLWPDEYEFFLDLRKVCKMSVSYLIAYAVANYLVEVINSFLKKPDNNRYKNYTIIGRVVDGIACWTYYWGVPRNLAEIS